MVQRLAVLAAAIFSLATPALATGPDALITRLMGHRPGQGKTFACFARAYDDAHLALHPDQNVRSMRVLAVAYSNMNYSVQLRMGFEFRGRPETLTTVAECGSHNDVKTMSAFCANAGSDDKTRIVVDGRRAIQVTLPSGPHLWKPGPPNPSDTVNDAFGRDDKVFRLDRAALSQCDDQAIDDEEKALLDRSR